MSKSVEDRLSVPFELEKEERKFRVVLIESILRKHGQDRNIQLIDELVTLLEQSDQAHEAERMRAAKRRERTHGIIQGELTYLTTGRR